MGAFDDRTMRALTFGLLASTALATPALAQNSAADHGPIAGARDQRDRRDRAAAAGAAGAGRQCSRPDRNHHHRDQARGELLQNVPISVHAIGTRRLDQLNISNFEEYTKQLPSVTFLTARRGDRRLYARHFGGGRRRRGQSLGSAAAGRHLSRRAAGHDDRRNARHPHLRHRPDRKPLGSAGHALRRIERSGHDPHHHQQAGTWSHRRTGRRRAQHASLTAASAASSKG